MNKLAALIDRWVTKRLDLTRRLEPLTDQSAHLERRTQELERELRKLNGHAKHER